MTTKTPDAARDRADAEAKDEAREAGARMVRLVEERGYLGSILGSDPATVERFKTVLLSALTSNPKLLRSDPPTLVQAMREAAMWDLEPDGVDAVIVPFWNSRRSVYEADFQPTARGYVRVLYRSPRIKFVDADVVYANDVFEFEKGERPRLIHKPLAFGDRGERLGAYALVQLDSGFVRPVVLNREQIEKRRRVARDSEKGPWLDWEDEMWRKTALRSLMSIVPTHRGVKQALAAESAKYDLLAPVTDSASLPEAKPMPALLAARAAFVGADESGPVQDATSDPEPVVVVSEPAPGPVVAQCPARSPWGDESDPCVLAAGHKGNHRTEGRESWS